MRGKAGGGEQCFGPLIIFLIGVSDQMRGENIDLTQTGGGILKMLSKSLW